MKDDAMAGAGAGQFSTHEVANQPPPLEGANLFAVDRALQEAVRREGAGWAGESLSAFGQQLGQPQTLELGRLANQNRPILRTHDRFGSRRDEVEFHPAYHELMSLGVAQALHAGPWAEPRPGAHAARAAAYLLYGQVENGTQCPITMTYAAVPVLERHAGALPVLSTRWLPRIRSRQYDRRFAPVDAKTGAMIGMGMTEKQGGSDVRTNSTRAEPTGARGTGRPYRITGHKWFMSAPMCDAFLILAQAPGGLSCFFLPRFHEDRINAVRLLRLKDKMGNHSNASSEVEFEGATAWLLGDEGRGVPTILEMVNYTRLDCAIGSAGIMRAALSQALHHARHRSAFGRLLAEQPLMKNVLADLALESEAATLLAMRLAGAYDHASSEREVALRRLLTPATKYWICKRLPAFAAEAMEVLGGNGYVEESALPRIFRESPLNSIWEGAGNVMCLDVLRVAAHEPQAVDAYFEELRAARGGDSRLDAFLSGLEREFARPDGFELRARRLTENLALGMQAALLLKHAPTALAEAFCASRLQRDHGAAFGTLPGGCDVDAIVARAW